ncbi:Lrp/AsnC family transcriptional regulator [Spirillospora sp. NPDC029432]|uniref:Lrp/AsnC family transcriptional regulator n=1 Tax=Spirillospora sp. NPDC029432 TaxID=3154599 RepID=UPI00345581DA
MPDRDTASPVMLDEVDFQIVTALQSSPRADWRRVGHAVGVDATTAARRWARLTEAGLAWISCYPGLIEGMVTVPAFIEVDCAPGMAHEAAARIAADPHVINVEHVTGHRDLLLTVLLSGQAPLSRYIALRLGRLPEVVATRTQIGTAVYAEGSRWRIDRLEGPVGEPFRAAQERAGRGRGAIKRSDMELVRLLGYDCRMPVARLAERTGLSPTTVRRKLQRLDADRALIYRCEVARFASGWPVAVSYWGAVAPAEVADVAARLAGLREIRLCTSLSGPSNLLFTVWLRSYEQIQAFEADLGRRFPTLEVNDSAVALWPMKLGCNILDPDGRHLRAVPFEPWSDAGVEAAQQDLLARLRARPDQEDRGGRDAVSR